MSTLDQSRVAEIRRLQAERDQNRDALEVADETLALIEDVGHGALSENVTAARRVILGALGRGGGDHESPAFLPPVSSIVDDRPPSDGWEFVAKLVESVAEQQKGEP
jgi:hypothetical protein